MILIANDQKEMSLIISKKVTSSSKIIIIKEIWNSRNFYVNIQFKCVKIKLPNIMYRVIFLLLLTKIIVNL